MSQAIANDRDQDRIDREASEWLVLREGRVLAGHELQAFDAWLAADPRHDATYAAMERTWNDISQLRSLAEFVRLEPALDAGTQAPQRGWRPRPAWLLGLAVAAAAALALLWLPSLSMGPEHAPQSYSTQVAEIHDIVLPDGTRVTLGPRTALTEQFTARQRRVVLAGGEAFFDVAHNAQRPFLIEAGGSVVRVTGTKFNVNASAGSLRVAVLEGSVQVFARHGPGQGVAAPQTLTAGQRLVVAMPLDANGTVVAASMPTLEMSTTRQPGSWRGGRLVYDDVRLADLIADVNRYYAPGVTLADEHVGQLRVTASFKASEIPAFIRTLSDVVPVRAEETATGGFRLRRVQN